MSVADSHETPRYPLERTFSVTRSIVRAALAAVAASLLLAGCSPGGRPLARVGSQTLTENDLLDAGRGNEMQYAGAPDEAKRALLDDLVRRQAMLEAAHRRGNDTTAIARNYLHELSDRTVLQALYGQLAPQDAGVSDAEMRRFYQNRSERMVVRVIYTIDPAMSAAALAALERGESFADVADRYNMPGAVPAGGLMGNIAPGQLVPPLDDALLTLKVGEIGGPYTTPQGTFLLTVDSREPAEQPAFETVQSQVGEMIRQRKVRETMARQVVRLREAHHVRVEPDAAQTLFRLLTPARVGEGVIPPLTVEDSLLVLGRWDGGTFTVGDAFQDMRRVDVTKPPAAQTPAIGQWIEGRIVIRAARDEAKARHLAQDPDVARRIRNDWERYLLEGEYQSIVGGVARPAEPEVRKAWDDIKGQYEQVSRANVLWVVVPDSASAVMLAMHGGHGSGTLADAARMAGVSAPVHREALAWPMRDPHSEWASMAQTFGRMQPGEWAGPDRVADGWRLFQLVDKVQAPVSFEGLPADMRMNLESNLWQVARDQRLQQYTDSLLTFLQPEIFTPNLRRVPWPPPRVVDVDR